jgi:cell division protein FtsA
MEGAVEFAEDVFQMPVRLGYPMHVSGLNEYVQDPAYASVVGLLLYGKDVRAQQKAAGQSRDTVSGLMKKISSWFKGEF